MQHHCPPRQLGLRGIGVSRGCQHYRPCDAFLTLYCFQLDHLRSKGFDRHSQTQGAGRQGCGGVQARSGYALLAADTYTVDAQNGRHECSQFFALNWIRLELIGSNWSLIVVKASAARVFAHSTSRLLGLSPKETSRALFQDFAWSSIILASRTSGKLSRTRRQSAPPSGHKLSRRSFRRLRILSRKLNSTPVKLSTATVLCLKTPTNSNSIQSFRARPTLSLLAPTCLAKSSPSQIL